MPVPVLVRPPVPDRTPEKLLVLLSAPVVRVSSSVTEPAPASEPMVSAAARIRVAPDSTVTALLSPIAEPPSVVRKPPDTVVAPV